MKLHKNTQLPNAARSPTGTINTVNTMTYTQTRTDTVNVAELDGIVWLQFTFAANPGTNGQRDRTTLVGPAAYRNAVGAGRGNVLDRLAKLRPVTFLTDTGADILHHEGVATLAGPARINTNLFVDIDDVDHVAAEIADLDDTARARRLIEIDFSSYGAWAVDADDNDGPLRVPVIVDISNRYVNIRDAQHDLENHPGVLHVEHDDGRPGSYDHVPASLHVTWLADTDTWTALCAHAIEQHGRYTRRGDRPPAPSGMLVEEYVVWRVRSDQNHPDPLGIRPHIRDEELPDPTYDGW